MLKSGQFRFADYVFSIVGAASVTLILVVVLLRPPLNDMIYLAVLLGLTGTASAATGFFFQRLGLWQRFGSLRQTVVTGYVLAAALTLLNVWITAKLMFVNQHDLALASLLLFFASGISVAFGVYLAGAVTVRLDNLAQGAARISEGDFSTRVDVQGDDEVARLTEMFNEMATRLEEMAKEAEAANQARRRLIAGASHDLRTPLAALRAMIDALAEGIVDDPQTTQRYLEQSQAEINRMSDLLDVLFDLARLDAGYVELSGERASLRDLISDTLAAFSARAQAKGVKLSGEAAEGIDPVWMDTNKISRVLNNLLDNALRHTAPGQEVRIAASRQENEVLVSVQDTGEGIDEAHLPHVFEHFYRGEESRSREGYDRGGAGLGLAIAQRLVEAHGGHISAASTTGQGTEIRFTLPRQGNGS